MTYEKYMEALAALRGRPERHLIIDNVQPSSVDELNAFTRKSEGFDPEENLEDPRTWGVYVPPVGESDQASVETEDLHESKEPAQVVDEATVAEKPSGEALAPPVDGGEQAPAGTPAASSPDSGNSENLANMKYKDKQALAKKLGIDPVPTAESELNAAIEAKRNGGS